ncbi:hypothetical protein N7540_011035 [Penicillium herquei]|nr:hypothetical protein N7540_011035 [Penicillium herquei]
MEIEEDGEKLVRRYDDYIFELSSEADIYLTPTLWELQADCANLFFKTSCLTPSEMFLAILPRPDVDGSAKCALRVVIERVGGERFLKKEAEGLTKIVRSIGKTVSVLLFDIATFPVVAVLASVTPAYDGQALAINWVAEFSVTLEYRITREIKAPLGVLSYFLID